MCSESARTGVEPTCDELGKERASDEQKVLRKSRVKKRITKDDSVGLFGHASIKRGRGGRGGGGERRLKR